MLVPMAELDHSHFQRALMRRVLIWMIATTFPLLGGVPGEAYQASQSDLDVGLVSLTSPVEAGDDASIAVRTAPAARCHITVHYKSGPSKAKGLVSKLADMQGEVSWTWQVGSRTTPGAWPIVVTCSHAGREGTLQTRFVVR